MLPNLSNLNISQCLPKDVTVFQRKLAEKTALVGNDAVFWPVFETVAAFGAWMQKELKRVYRFYESPGNDTTTSLQELFDKDMKVHQYNTETVEEIGRENIEKTLNRDEDQFLYHYTDYFPSDRAWKEEAAPTDTIETKGYLWTSTSKDWTWNCIERVTIIIPRGLPEDRRATLILYDTPNYGKQFVCEYDMTRTHNDVVLPPARFKLVERSSRGLPSVQEERGRIFYSLLCEWLIESLGHLFEIEAEDEVKQAVRVNDSFIEIGVGALPTRHSRMALKEEDKKKAAPDVPRHIRLHKQLTTPLDDWIYSEPLLSERVKENYFRAILPAVLPLGQSETNVRINLNLIAMELPVLEWVETNPNPHQSQRHDRPPSMDEPAKRSRV